MDYNILITESEGDKLINNLIKNEISKNNIAIIDKFIFDNYFQDFKKKKRILVIKSSEKIKTLEMSNNIINFFINRFF